MSQFTFRPLRANDLPLVQVWLNAGPVREWYAQRATSLAEVEAKYLPRIERAESVSVFVAMVEATSVGLFQYYAIASFPEYERAIRARPGWYGVDFFIGDPESRGRGYAPTLLAAFEQVVAAGAPNYTALVAGPNPRNEASIHSLGHAGFVHRYEVQVPSHEYESIMVRDRAPLETAI